MSDRRYRVLAVATHPVQYLTPIFRRLAKHPALDFQVAYCSARGAGVPVVQEILVECKTLPQILEEFSLQSVRLCKVDVEGAELAILKTLSPADLPRMQSFALEYRQEAYDLQSLLRLVLDWRTHQVRFIGASLHR